eukprot:706441-Alexandrium_andersonii.AAC.1
MILSATACALSMPPQKLERTQMPHARQRSCSLGPRLRSSKRASARPPATRAIEISGTQLCKKVLLHAAVAPRQEGVGDSAES